VRRLTAILASGALVAALAAPAPALAADPTVTGRQLVPGAALPGGSWGMDFDADDHLWVGHIGSRTITELNANSGKVLATYGPEGGFEGSDDLTVGPDGAVYYTAILTGEVGRINTDGTHSTVANLGVGVNPITFSDDGRLFVGLAFMADGLFEVYPDSATPPRLINATPGINGFDWWDGYL
jgi:streptogramin lyase